MASSVNDTVNCGVRDMAIWLCCPFEAIGLIQYQTNSTNGVYQLWSIMQSSKEHPWSMI
jgi:hypothetical protein